MRFIDDLTTLNDISDETFELLIQEFGENPIETYPELARFEYFCKKNSIDQEIGSKLFNVLAYILDYLIDSRNISDGLKYIEENILNYYSNEVQKIWKRIAESSNKFEEFIILRKELKLKDLSNTYNSFKIVCDIRPLYDLKREKIIKYLYPVILSIKQKGTDKNIVFEIYEEQLALLKEEIEIATNKLKQIKNNFEISDG